MTIRRIRRIYRLSGILSVLCLISLSGQTKRESIEENGLLSPPESTAQDSTVTAPPAPSIIEPDWKSVSPCVC